MLSSSSSVAGSVGFLAVFVAVFMSLLPQEGTAQTLPNPGFEQWQPIGTACENPSEWDSPNGGLGLFGICSVTKETANVNGGDAAVRMETVLVPLISIKAPAALTTGTLVVDAGDPFNSGVQGGSVTWGMPDALTGYYDYQPMGGDSLTIRIRLFDVTGDDTTLIAIAEHVDNATTGGYVPFTLPITYMVTEDAELAEVLIRSTRNTMDATVGTVLFVDDFTLTGISSIGNSGTRPQPIAVYPNPAQDRITVRNPLLNEAVFSLYNAQGQLVYEQRLAPGDQTLYIGALPAGMYAVHMATNDGSRSSGMLRLVD